MSTINVHALVRVNRGIENLAVAEGSTVFQLRHLLEGAGHDVVGARTRFLRNDKIHIGRVDGVVLKQNDEVWFEKDTKTKRNRIVYKYAEECGCGRRNTCRQNEVDEREEQWREEERERLQARLSDLEDDIADLRDQLNDLD